MSGISGQHRTYKMAKFHKQSISQKYLLLHAHAHYICIVCARGGGYSHIRTVRICATRKPPPPILRPWRPYGLLLRPGLFQKTPFSKIYNSWFRFFDLDRSKRPLFKKHIRFFVIFSSKIPCFSHGGPLWKPPLLSEGPFSKPPIFKTCAAHIYQFYI